MADDSRHKRRFARHDTHMPVKLTTETDLIDAVATSLAVGGLFVTHEEPLPPGTCLMVTMTLGEEQMTIPSLVVHNRDGGMGVEFTDITPNDLKHIRRFFADNDLDMLET